MTTCFSSKCHFDFCNVAGEKINIADDGTTLGYVDEKGWCYINELNAFADEILFVWNVIGKRFERINSNKRINILHFVAILCSGR